MTIQFQQTVYLLFGGFLLFETSVRLEVERLQRSKCGIIYCMHCHVRYIHNVGKNGRTPSNLAQWASSPGAAARRGGAHSLIWLKNVQKVCPFAYAPIERHLTILLTCRLFPRVPYAFLEVCQALLFHTITREYP